MMKTTFLAALLGLSALQSSGEETRVKSPTISSENSKEAIALASKQGIETAKKDIKAGTPVILYFGKPWSQNKPLIDESTGLKVQIVGGSVVTQCFVAEVKGYNSTVRSWVAKTKEGGLAVNFHVLKQ